MGYVSWVIDMSGMFQDATAFNQDISKWYVGSVQNTTYMFRNAEIFQRDLTMWKGEFSYVLQEEMFKGARKFLERFSCLTRMMDL